MSGEIRVTANVKVDNGIFHFPLVGQGQQAIDQAVQGGGLPGMILVDLAEEDVPLTDLDTPGICWIKNLGAIGSSSEPVVTLGPKDSGNLIPLIQLKVGEAFVFRLDPSVTLRIKSDTPVTQVQIHVFED